MQCIKISVILLTVLGDIAYRYGIASARRDQDCTDLARDDETLLVFSTLGGGLTAVDPLTSEVRWSIEDEPAIKVPIENDIAINPQYLPDPRDGSLYQLGERGGLKKLPYTIPQLVASAPCRSSDGILYSGKKSDTWFLIDPKTGRREEVLGFGRPPPFKKKESIGWATSRAIYLGRTQYTVLMYDSRNENVKQTKPWNVTFFDYTSHTMAPEVSKEYEWLHLSASASGLTVTLDRVKGTFLWQLNLASPVVATFILASEGLLSVPFTTVSDNTLQSIIEYARDGQKNDIKLFQTLYVGEHSNGLYALPSLVDKSVATISSDPPIKLLDGPHNDDTISATTSESKQNLVYLNALLHKNKLENVDDANVIVLGHYQMPKTKDDLKLSIVPSLIKKPFTLDSNRQELTMPAEHHQREIDVFNVNTAGSGGVIVPTDQQQKSNYPLDGDENMSIDGNKSYPRQIQLNSDDIGKGFLQNYYYKSKNWLDEQESKILKLLLIILIGLIVAMFWYTRCTVRELRLSQSGSQRSEQLSGNGDGSGGGSNNSNGSNKSYQELIDLGAGEVRIGKITFNTIDVLGKGCEGTFVFRGLFEKRDVAVKRLLPECFTLAEREVSLLRESDAHENVVRYFCTEQDRQFKYIALELCVATLQDYVEHSSNWNEKFQSKISIMDILRQATSGLVHLHSLSIVHRDIKPQNVLISQPNAFKIHRAMISDFGLCKKLNFGKTSFSRRSGITGTEGWIAPEMLKGQRTTTAVDIFSLGCVFYYVISNGGHPFGEPIKRQGNILSNEYDLKYFQPGYMDSNFKILAEELIIAMIANNPSNRPAANMILNHPFFWSDDKILNFLQDVSDRVEKVDFQMEPLLTLEKNSRFVCCSDWNTHLHDCITADLKKYRGYHGHSVRDLLRAIRNKKHHYHELTPEMQTVLGGIPQEFTNYWLQRFSRLLSHSFHALQQCSSETIFRAYYCENYAYAKPDYFYRKTLDFLPQHSDRETKHLKENMNATMLANRPTANRKAMYNFHRPGNQINNNNNNVTIGGEYKDEISDNGPKHRKLNYKKRKVPTPAMNNNIRWTLPTVDHH